MGNDYGKRIPNVGHKTIFKKIFPKLVTWDVNELQNVINSNLKHKMTDIHKNKLSTSINLCLHAPMLNEQNVLRPLNDAIINDYEWGILIGFQNDPNDIVPVDDNNYAKARLFIDCSFTTCNGQNYLNVKF